MGATLVLMRDATAVRPLLLLLRLTRHATASRPVLLLLLSPRYATAPGPVLLLLRLPRHAIAAKNHTIVHLMTSVAPDPPVPITTADDKSMRIWGSRRRTRRRPSLRKCMSLALRIGGTDGVLSSRVSDLGVGQGHCFYGIVPFRELAKNDLNDF